MHSEDRVIVSGCGPVGAVMTLALVRKGIPVTLIEQLPDAARISAPPPSTRRPSRCWSISASKRKCSRMTVRRHAGAAVSFPRPRQRRTDRGVRHQHAQGEVPYPYVVQWEQYKLVQAVLPHIRATASARCAFDQAGRLAQTADHVEATVTNAAGESETLRARYLIGADGGSSAVRRLAEIVFEVSPGPTLHQDRHDFRFRLDRAGSLHAQLFLRSR